MTLPPPESHRHKGRRRPEHHPKPQQGPRCPRGHPGPCALHSPPPRAHRPRNPPRPASPRGPGSSAGLPATRSLPRRAKAMPPGAVPLAVPQTPPPRPLAGPGILPTERSLHRSAPGRRASRGGGGGGCAALPLPPLPQPDASEEGQEPFWEPPRPLPCPPLPRAARGLWEQGRLVQEQPQPKVTAPGASQAVLTAVRLGLAPRGHPGSPREGAVSTAGSPTAPLPPSPSNLHRPCPPGRRPGPSTPRRGAGPGLPSARGPALPPAGLRQAEQ